MDPAPEGPECSAYRDVRLRAGRREVHAAWVLQIVRVEARNLITPRRCRSSPGRQIREVRRHRRLVQLGEEMKSRLHEVLGDDGVLVHPPYPTVAPKHYKAMWPPFNFVHCAIFNTMQVPSTSVPMGLDARGIPTGVQVVAGPEQDHLGIACALALEADCGGWVPPWSRQG